MSVGSEFNWWPIIDPLSRWTEALFRVFAVQFYWWAAGWFLLAPLGGGVMPIAPNEATAAGATGVVGAVVLLFLALVCHAAADGVHDYIQEEHDA